MKVKSKILCPITDWKESTVERGPTTGTKTIRRKVVGADPWNWFIGTEVKGKDNIVPDAYFGSMRMLLQSLDGVTEDAAEAANVIIGRLVEMTKETPEIKSNSPFSDLEKLGEWIDINFKTSFHKPYPPRVFYDVFGDKAPENEDEPCFV